MNKKEGRIKYTAVFDDEIRRKLDGYLDEEDMYISKEKFYIDIKKIIDHVEELSVEEKEMDNNISGYLENNIIYLNSNHHENRKRFTMAHELGHFLLRHQGVNYRTSKKEIYEGLHDYINEREANSFAAELLMPELQMRALYEKYIKDNKINEESTLNTTQRDMLAEYISNMLKVSPASARFRLMNMGLI